MPRKRNDFDKMLKALTDTFGTKHVDWHEFEGQRTVYIRAGKDRNGKTPSVAAIHLRKNRIGQWETSSVETSIPLFWAVTTAYPEARFDRLSVTPS